VLRQVGSAIGSLGPHEITAADQPGNSRADADDVGRHLVDPSGDVAMVLVYLVLILC
jgi:hypothetical protein